MSHQKRCIPNETIVAHPVVATLAVMRAAGDHGGYAPLATYSVVLKKQTETSVSLMVDHPRLRWLITAPTKALALEEMQRLTSSFVTDFAEPVRGIITAFPEAAHSLPTPRGLGNLVIADLIAYQATANLNAKRGDQLLMFHPSEIAVNAAGYVSPGGGGYHD